MIDVNCCTLNGKEYIEVDRIENKDKVYAYLVNEQDEYDFMVRIVNKEGDSEFYDPLTSQAEFEKAMALFLRKNINTKEDKAA